MAVVARRCTYDLGSCLFSLGEFGICLGDEAAHADTRIFAHAYRGRCGKPLRERKYTMATVLVCADGHEQ